MVFHNGQLKGFNFHNVFGDRSTQDEVFRGVAEPLINDCLYNGTRSLTRQERITVCLWSLRRGKDLLDGRA